MRNESIYELVLRSLTRTNFVHFNFQNSSFTTTYNAPILENEQPRNRNLTFVEIFNNLSIKKEIGKSQRCPSTKRNSEPILSADNRRNI